MSFDSIRGLKLLGDIKLRLYKLYLMKAFETGFVRNAFYIINITNFVISLKISN